MIHLQVYEAVFRQRLLNNVPITAMSIKDNHLVIVAHTTAFVYKIDFADVLTKAPGTMAHLPPKAECIMRSAVGGPPAPYKLKRKRQGAVEAIVGAQIITGKKGKHTYLLGSTRHLELWGGEQLPLDRISLPEGKNSR